MSTDKVVKWILLSVIVATATVGVMKAHDFQQYKNQYCADLGMTYSGRLGHCIDAKLIP
jgi:hypothetical protein